jgi:hypothetical protein
MTAATVMTTFLYGANTLGYFLGAIFFLQGFRRTRDALFLVFSAAFALFSVNEAATALQLLPAPDESLAFLLRLAGFVILIVAIIWKNLTAERFS